MYEPKDCYSYDVRCIGNYSTRRLGLWNTAFLHCVGFEDGPEGEVYGSGDSRVCSDVS